MPQIADLLRYLARAAVRNRSKRARAQLHNAVSRAMAVRQIVTSAGKRQFYRFAALWHNFPSGNAKSSSFTISTEKIAATLRSGSDGRLLRCEV
jgi:hypothetical protein